MKFLYYWHVTTFHGSVHWYNNCDNRAKTHDHNIISSRIIILQPRSTFTLPLKKKKKEAIKTYVSY